MKRSLIALMLSMIAILPAARADEDNEMSRETYILLHALNDALQASDFVDCRVGMSDRSLYVDRARFHAEVGFYQRRTEIKVDNDVVIVSGYRPGEDGWHQQNFTIKLSGDRKRIRGVRYRESLIEHVNVGTISRPEYKTVLTPLQQFYCQAN